MFSKENSPLMRSAAWRISLWATAAFAIGTMFVFAELHRFVAKDIQRRSDAWLSGAVAELGGVAERTPKDRLNGRFVREIAELASHEVPNREPSNGNTERNDSVFFLQADDQGPPRLWVGKGNQNEALSAIRNTRPSVGEPFDIYIEGFQVPFRVTSLRISDGSKIYLGLSEYDERRVLGSLRTRFTLLWLANVLLSFVIVFYATYRMLRNVRRITEAASVIGQSDLTMRVPDTESSDEIGHLAQTLNHMLDRIQNTVSQLHSITDSLAHDLRSPLTAIRGKLESALSRKEQTVRDDAVAAAIEQLDRLTDFLNTSLDVAEAKADALRLTRSDFDLDELVRSMVALYEPSMHEKGLTVVLGCSSNVTIHADSALMHRVIANLLDNELKHLSAPGNVWLSLRSDSSWVTMTVEDDGPGLDDEIARKPFESRAKGSASRGHGLGLAFVEAVVKAHGGQVTATNRSAEGIRIELTLPLASHS